MSWAIREGVLARVIWASSSVATLLLPAAPAFGDTHYVSPSGTHQPPFTNWPTAATDIQAAIDVAVDGDTVLVTNGVYDTGGVVVHGAITNRIAITNAVTVSSVNGPDFTFIVGSGPLGPTAVRCAYVGVNARLEGFTLTGGHTLSTGVWQTETIGGGAWCEPSAVLSNCVVSSNTAYLRGGGVTGGTALECVITSNRTTIARAQGGGAIFATLVVCWIGGNESYNGGGTANCSEYDCTVVGNVATYAGGGVYNGDAYGCIILGNSAGDRGGGVLGGSIDSCTVVGNTAGSSGGGSTTGHLRNSIVYHNLASNGVDNCRAPWSVTNTCTTPLIPGAGNITNDPQFVDAMNSNFHLLSTSPCIDAGSNQAWMVGATDLDGVQRIVNATVDMGAYESLSPAITDIASSSNGLIITWHSASNMEYAVYGDSNLVDGLDLLQDQIPATPPFNTYTDAVGGVEMRSYGVEVEP